MTRLAEQKELSLEIRVLIAFALSALVLVFFAPKQQKKPPAPPAAVAGAVTPAGKTAEPEKPVAVPAQPSSPKQESAEAETVVENDLYAVRFSNKGGVVRSWVLKSFQDGAGKPLDLVNAATAKEYGAPFSFWVEDAPLRDKLNQALFVADLSSPRAPATLTFEYSDGQVSARKEFHFEHASYVVEVRSELRRGVPLPHELAWRGGFGDHSLTQAHLTNQVTISQAGKHEHHSNKDIKGEMRPPGPFTFVSLEDLFFGAVFMPGPDVNTVPSAILFKNDYKPNADKDALPLVGLAAGGSAVNTFRVYVGPKALDLLGKITPIPGDAKKLERGESVETLAELIDFGWFSFVAAPLFVGLKWIFVHIVPNYGWAIILLTIVINFALFPLKLSSMKSALKMSKVQPQIAAINRKYEKLKLTDPRQQEKNQEIMALYKKEGINPVGGCLPVVLQIPFLYGFYKVLSLSIEMRHASWLWVADLSQPEPHWFKILPLLMIVSTVVLQKMTPQTATDPVQQKMFMLMPLMFGVMFYNFSAGLVLYWLVGNLVQIGQQWYISKTEMRRKMAE